MVTHKEIVFGIHNYQPVRKAHHTSLESIATDPRDFNHTAAIADQCYTPLQEKGILKQVSFDTLPVLIEELMRYEKLTSGFFNETQDTAIGSPFFHPILPFLNRTDKLIAIESGYNYFVDRFSFRPKQFWAPETAVDNETLEVAHQVGYESVILAPWQVKPVDGRMSDNQAFHLKLPNGSAMTAIIYDGILSSQLAFESKSNADVFFYEHMQKRIHDFNRLITWVDGETFGHHSEFGDMFLAYLLNETLPREHIHPVEINTIDWQKAAQTEAQLVERSAWSCHCGNLARWQGSCGCEGNHNSPWKKPFLDSLLTVNRVISDIISDQLGPDYYHQVIEQFLPAYNYSGLQSSGEYSLPAPAHAGTELAKTPTMSLIASKVKAMLALTSCATFFNNIDTSGRINVVHVYESLAHLKDAGFGQIADQMAIDFATHMSHLFSKEDGSTPDLMQPYTPLLNGIFHALAST